MTLAEFIQQLERLGELQPSPFEPIRLPHAAPRGSVACECEASVWLRHERFEDSTTQEVTAVYIGQCSECLRIYWHP